MKALISRELEGSKVRSPVRWLEDGKRPTRYFFKLEHERVARNSVTSILDSNDVEVLRPSPSVFRKSLSKLFIRTKLVQFLVVLFFLMFHFCAIFWTILN